MKNILLVGASGGIGHKTAEKLLEKGYRVYGTYFQHPERVIELKKNTLFTDFYLDLKDSNTLKNVKKETKELFAVVNCAGICEFEGNNLDTDLDIWSKTLAVNLTGNYLLGKMFYDQLIENGRFVMLASTDAYYGGTITTGYAASKAGIISLTKSFSLLFREKKIRVNSLAPGWVITPMIAENGEEFLQKVADINPLKRNAEPIDIANFIQFLLSEHAGYLNGQIISLEGGYTNQDPTLILEEEVNK